MKVEHFIRRLARLRRVANYIDGHLDGALNLDELADVARMSRFHFERSFASYAGEPPLARVRRLRLARARQRIEAGEASSLLELALDSGYASAEAFSRAFRAMHGLPPSQWPDAPLENGEMPLRLVALPAVPIQYIPFRGRMDEAIVPFEELRARAMLAGIARERRKGWSVHLGGEVQRWHDEVEIHAALLAEPLGTRVAGLDTGALPAGDYAVFGVRGGYDAPPLGPLAERVLRETGRRVVAGPVLRCFNNAAYLPAEQEKRFDLYLPLAPA